MLKGLDAVPWSDLKRNFAFTAYNNDLDIPALLRQLINEDPEKRSQAWGKLYDNVFHQGSRFGATAYILPFIIELCAEPSVPDRNSLLWFWGYAITGYFSVRERPTWGDGETIYEYGEVCQWRTEGEDYEGLHQIYRESLKGKELLFDLLNDDDIYLRRGAIRVLASMPTIAELSVPKLEKRLERETADNMRGSIAFALGELGASTPLLKLVAELEISATKCMAVCQLARINPQECLIEPLLHFVSNRVEEYRNLVGAGGKSTDDAAFAISHLSRHLQQQAIPAICQRLKQARSFDTVPLVNTLLSAAFEELNKQFNFSKKPYKPLTELTQIQNLVLSQMLMTDELWSIGNLIGTFRIYGLPFSKEDCAKLVGIELTTDEALTELRWGLAWAEMGVFLEKARNGINRAVEIDNAVFERVPSPEEAWLLCAKAFAEVDEKRSLSAFRQAYLINPAIVDLVSPHWYLAKLLNKNDF